MMLRTGKDLPDLTAEDIFSMRAHYRERLIRHLEERKTGVDYTMLKGLARMLAGNFRTDWNVTTLNSPAPAPTLWLCRKRW